MSEADGDELRDKLDEIEFALKAAREEWSDVRVELMEIRAKARFEQEHPTGLHMTCLSLIEKAADRALKRLEAAE